MNASPKPAPPKRPLVIAEEVEQNSPVPAKKPFVPTEHLTSNPFRDSEALRDLQKQMRKDNPVKRSVRPTRGAAPKKEKK